MPGYAGVEFLLPNIAQRGQGAGLVRPHQLTISDDVGGKYGGQPPGCLGISHGQSFMIAVGPVYRSVDNGGKTRLVKWEAI